MSAYAIVALTVLTLFIPIAAFFVGVLIANDAFGEEVSLALAVSVMGIAITLAHLVYIL